MKRNKKKPQSDITKEKLQGVILITIMCVPAFYYSLVFAQTLERPYGSRIGEAVMGTVLDIASPTFWAFVMLCAFLFDIGRLSVKYFQEKKEEKAQAKE